MTNEDAKREMSDANGKCRACGKTSHRASSRQLWKCYWSARYKAQTAALSPLTPTEQASITEYRKSLGLPA